VLELSEGPPGITLADVKFMPRLVSFTLKVAEGSAAVGFADNLIVQAFMEQAPDPAKGRKTARRVMVGMLPAIPIRIKEKEESGS
jgi:hypothetical protein